jgi:hypothetical protein
LATLSLASLAWAWEGSAAGPLPSLDDLLKQYQALGLPMPPKEAKLVRYEAGGGGIVNRKVQPKVYGVAFQIKAGTETESPCLLRGVYEWQPSWDAHAQELAPEPTALKDLVEGSGDELVLAIQCHARGWGKLAHYLLEKSQKEKELPAPNKLIRLAWDYWESRLTQPKIDRAPIAKRLKELIGQDKKLNTKRNRALLKSLSLALVPSKAEPGSIEALIDDLVDYSANAGTIGIFELEDRYWRIAKLGFEAVPDLIQHLDDDRLTRAMMIGFNNFGSWHLRVRDVVGDLLEGLAAEELMRGANGENVGGGWLRRQQGYPITVAAASQWWEKARKAGEEPYLLAHVLPADTDRDGNAQVSVHLLNVILAKYPKHIPALYRMVLDKRPELHSGVLAHAVVRCNLSNKEKLDQLLYAAKHENNAHRLPALYAIKDLDRKQFTELLLTTIDSFPKDVPGPYWTCPEAYIGRLAIETDDPRIWQTLEKVAKRSAFGLRMELLNHFSDPKESRHKLDRLRLLATFIDDADVWDQNSSPKFDGPGAGFPYERLEVRDFVALQIARLVGIEVELNLDRTPNEWAKIRSQVKDALKRELSKKD